MYVSGPVQTASRPARPLLDAAEPLARVGGEVALRLLAVVHDVEAHRDLAPDDLADGGAHEGREGGRIVRTAVVLRGEHVAEVVGPRQAAGVRGEDALGAAFHRGPPSESAE